MPEDHILKSAFADERIQLELSPNDIALLHGALTCRIIDLRDRGDRLGLEAAENMERIADYLLERLSER